MELIAYLVGLLLSIISTISGLLVYPTWKKTRWVKAIISVAYVFLSIIDIMYSGVVSRTMVSVLSRHIIRIGSTMYIIAVIPSITAKIERKARHNDRIASNSYLIGNLVYNLLGASVVMALAVVFNRYANDISGIIRFPLIGFLALFTQASIFLIILYQENERGIETPDHLTGDRYINQTFNLCFLSIVITTGLLLLVMIAGQSFSDNFTGVNENVWLLCIFLGILLFFYACSFNGQKHVRFVYSVCTPIIISLMAVWMVKYTDITRTIIFMMIALFIYVILQLRMNGFHKNLILSEPLEGTKSVHIGKKYIAISKLFGVFLIAFIILICLIVLAVGVESRQLLSEQKL